MKQIEDQIELWVARLGDDQWSAPARMHLVEFGEPAMQAVLEALHRPKNLTMLENAADVLTAFGQPAVRLMVDAINDGTAHQLPFYASIFRAVGSTLATESLIKMLSNPSSWVRSCAVAALSSIADERSVAPIERLLKDRSSEVRLEAAKALGKLGNVHTLPMLEKALTMRSNVRRPGALDAIHLAITNIIEREATSHISSLRK